jgi:UDP-GlcNAc:undecaprenyl-phosphate/decaprenyl-phosphate GlcNAc-1-phosphate transferase
VSILFIYFIALLLLELLYFRIADRFNIIDKPNERSSHSVITLRGGGIIFPIAWLLVFVTTGFTYPWFTLGLVLISLVSFWDDISTVSSKLRFGIQLLAFALCFYELNLYSILEWYFIPIAFVLCIGCLNAINFMDGINGMTGLYALSILLPLFISTCTVMDITLNVNAISILIISIIVRKKAKCFAGDVGSVSIGMILIFYVLKAVLWSPIGGHQEPSMNNYIGDYYDAGPLDFHYILFFAIYGIDAIFTIVQRLWNKENIFQPHRKHLYQYLANEMKWPHLVVSGLYALLQLVINVLVLNRMIHGWGAVLFLFVLGIFYIVVKYRLHKKLFTNKIRPV